MHTITEFKYFSTAASAKKCYSRLLDPICQEWNLTRTELDVILFLHNNPEFNRAADIVSHRGLAKSHVSLSVASLEEKGLLQRHFSEQDRRTAHLELRDRGRVIAEQASRKQLQFLSVLYWGISPEEFAVWKNIAHKILDNIAILENTEVLE